MDANKKLFKDIKAGDVLFYYMIDNGIPMQIVDIEATEDSFLEEDDDTFVYIKVDIEPAEDDETESGVCLYANESVDDNGNYIFSTDKDLLEKHRLSTIEGLIMFHNAIIDKLNKAR